MNLHRKSVVPTQTISNSFLTQRSILFEVYSQKIRRWFSEKSTCACLTDTSQRRAVGRSEKLRGAMGYVASSN